MNALPPLAPRPLLRGLPGALRTRGAARLLPLLLPGLLLASLSLEAAPPRKARPAKPSKAQKQPQAAPASDLPTAGSPGELVDLATGKGLAIGPMGEARMEFAATVFPDGRVLVSGGGVKGPGTEWFDPARRAFSPAPPLLRNRQGHRALLLPGGRLLVAGGTEENAPAEILEPGEKAFKDLPGEARFGFSAELLLLPDGQVLMLDGGSGKAWTWEPRGGSLRGAGSLAEPRILFRATALPDGRVLVTGGWPAPPDATRPRADNRPAWGRRAAAAPAAAPSTTPLAVESFDPRKRRWSAWKLRLAPRARHGALLLPDGRVCLFGGFGAEASTMNGTLELLDPARESVQAAGTLPPGAQAAPGWTPLGQGLALLPEGGAELRQLPDARQAVEALKAPAAQAADPVTPGRALRLANAFLNPTLLPLPGDRLLVLGSAAWGPALERWDPRTRQGQYLAALRAGTTTLAQAADGRVLALGAVVDEVDPRSGALRPLGRPEELASLLAKARPALPLPPGRPPFPAGEDRKDYLLLPLDKGRCLVLGGLHLGTGSPLDAVLLWDLRKRSLGPWGRLSAPRRFGPAPDQGALLLKDGSVLVWGPAETK